MPREFSLYQGAAPQAPQRHQVSVPDIAPVPMRGGQLDNVLAGAEKAVLQYSDLHDLGVQQQEELALKDLEARKNEDFNNRMSLKWGEEGSFYNEDGTRNKNAEAEFVAKWQDENDKIPRNYWLGNNRMQGETRQEEVRMKIANGLSSELQAQELKNIRAVWQDNYEAELAKKNYGNAQQMIDEAVQRGLLRPSQGNLMKVKLAKTRIASGGGRSRGGSGGGMTLGGKRYCNPKSALLAASQQRQREPLSADDEVQGEPQPSEVQNVQNEPEQGSLTSTMPQGGEELPAAGEPLTMPKAHTEPVQDSLTTTMPQGGTGLPADGEPLTMPKDPMTAFLEDDDLGIVFKNMSVSEFSDYRSQVEQAALAVPCEEQEDGSRVFRADPSAPESVQRMTAQANEDGEVNPDAARGVVANLTLAAVADDPSATAEQLVKMFDDSGIFEALGEGDAEMGKVRVHAIVNEMRERGQSGTQKVNLATIQALVKARVEQRDFCPNAEWKQMEGLNPGLKEGETWNKDDRDKWFALYRVYEKYRAEYNPDAVRAGTPLAKDEFNEKAQGFYNWYMGSSHHYKDAKKADTDAAVDWYTAKVTETLKDNLNVAPNGVVNYGGYATDMRVVEDALAQTPPETLGVAARARVAEEQEKANAKRSEAFRLRAEKDTEKLRTWKQQHREHSDKAAKAKEREEAREVREAEKQRKAEEKAAEDRRIRSLNAARHQPRTSAWVWDGEDDEDGGEPCALLPEGEYRRLVEELGYDGTQDVSIMAGGKKIRVVGTSKDNRIHLNTQAVFAIQAKPKKGEHYRTSGSKLGYSYYFKTTTTK